MKLQVKNINPKCLTMKCRQDGFTLVEIMVAMVIGLLGVIVIMQVFSLFEGQKRTTTGGADSQNNGAIAIYGIQRDIRQSGYGINSPKLIGCNVALPAPTAWTLTMAPVTINPLTTVVPAGDTNTDTLLIIYGNSTGATEGDAITDQSSGQNFYGVASPSTFNDGDYVIAQPQSRPTPCSLNLEKSKPVTSTIYIEVTNGAAGLLNGNLFNMGQKPKILAYRVSLGNLTVCDYTVNNCGAAADKDNGAVWVPVADNIVSMRAQYGRDTNTKPMDGIVDVWDQTTPTPDLITTNCDWLKISSIRLVIVSRSAQPEKTLVTDVANVPQWMGEVSAPIDLTNTVVPDGFTWQNYRYKTFQTIVPIRNITPVITSGVDAGC